MCAYSCAVCPSGVVVQKEKEPQVSSIWSRPVEVLKNEHLWITSELVVNSNASSMWGDKCNCKTGRSE